MSPSSVAGSALPGYESYRMAWQKQTTHRFGTRLEIERYRLHNGLLLLVLADHGAPVIALQTWLAVGSRHEREGKTGIAHLFEHLMFHETETMPYGEIDRRLEEAGVESNAATHLDWTYYMHNLPREALGMVIELEAERMARLVLNEPQLESEREVVANERRQTVDDDVDGAVAERLWSHAFTTHSYRWPTIGFMPDIQRLDLGDCERFYATYYAPNNATMVVVGDVDVGDVLDRVETAYGAMAPAIIPNEAPMPEPAQRVERRASVMQPTSTARLVVGYKSPPMGHSDHAALVLLNEIVFGGRASRAHRRLVQELEVATDVHGGVGSFRDPSLWEMGVVGREGRSPEELSIALDAVLDELLAVPASAAELGRAHARVELSTLSSLETDAGKAEQIGFGELVLADPAACFGRLDAMARLGPDELAQVATRYLRRNARTIVQVVPFTNGEAA